MADAHLLAGVWMASLAFAAWGVAPLAHVPPAPGAERSAMFGELGSTLQPAGAQAGPRLTSRGLHFPWVEVRRGDARWWLPGNVSNSALPAAMDRRWCNGRLEPLGPQAAGPTSPTDGVGGAAASATPVNVPDAVLQRAFEDALDKAPGASITRGELATLRALDTESGLRQLAGIEWAVNLRELCATRGAISDLAPLAGLSSLTGLVLSGHAIADVSPLSGLASLTILDLAGNAISDLAPLANLRSLMVLHLVDNAISDVAPLAGMESLEELYLGGNAISDVAPLAGARSLQALGLGGNTIADVAPLATLPSLTALSLNDNPGLDLASLEGLTSLRTLALYDNEISDVAPLAGLESLTALYLGGNPIADLAPLAGLPSLETLLLSSNEVELGGLAEVTSLTTLYLNHSAIADLSPLANLTSLTTLDLWDNAISDLSPLANLHSLTILRLDGNAAADLAPLAGLTSLTSLSLGGNAISDIAPLAGLTSLTSLSLGGNAISDIAPLAGLTSLTNLYLGSNAISDVAPLAGLRSLTSLGLGGNAISDLAPLAALHSLTRLGLGPNAISDLAPLAGLTSLTNLHLGSNAISDLSPLAGLTSLTTLNLGSNAISALAPLAGLKSLTTLYLPRNRASEIAPLAGLTSLTMLDLDYNAISDVAPLAGLKSLTALWLAYNQLTDIRPLGQLPRLRMLDLSLNGLEALPPELFADVGTNSREIIETYRPARVYGPVRGLTTLKLHGNPGAPFELAIRPVLASAAGERPARVALHLAEGAPLALNVPLDANGGGLAADVATIAPGALRSNAQAVWPAGRGPVIVSASDIPDLPRGLECADLIAGRESCDDVLEYTGIKFKAGEPLVLKHLAQYSDLEEPAAIDLAAVFRDFDGSAPAAFTTRTSDPAVAVVEVTGTVLRIVPVAPGVATITVTASAADGRTETRLFDVTVPGGSSLRGWRWKLLDDTSDARPGSAGRTRRLGSRMSEHMLTAPLLGRASAVPCWRTGGRNSACTNTATAAYSTADTASAPAAPPSRMWAACFRSAGRSRRR